MSTALTVACVVAPAAAAAGAGYLFGHHRGWAAHAARTAATRPPGHSAVTTALATPAPPVAPLEGRCALALVKSQP